MWYGKLTYWEKRMLAHKLRNVRWQCIALSYTREHTYLHSTWEIELDELVRDLGGDGI